MLRSISSTNISFDIAQHKFNKSPNAITITLYVAGHYDVEAAIIVPDHSCDSLNALEVEKAASIIFPILNESYKNSSNSDGIVTAMRAEDVLKVLKAS